MKKIASLFFGAVIGLAWGEDVSRIRIMGFEAGDSAGAQPLIAPTAEDQFARVIRFEDSKETMITRQISQVAFSPFMSIKGGKAEVPIFRGGGSKEDPWVKISLPKTGDYLLLLVRNEEGNTPSWKEPKTFVFEAVGEGEEKGSLHFLNASSYKVLFRSGRSKTLEIESGLLSNLGQVNEEAELLVGIRDKEGKSKVAFKNKAGATKEGTRRYMVAVDSKESGVAILHLEESGDQIKKVSP